MSLIVVSGPWPRPGNRLNPLSTLPCLSPNTARHSYTSNYAPRIQGASALPPLADGPRLWVAGLAMPAYQDCHHQAPSHEPMSLPRLAWKRRSYQPSKTPACKGSRSFTRSERQSPANAYGPYTCQTYPPALTEYCTSPQASYSFRWLCYGTTPPPLFCSAPTGAGFEHYTFEAANALFLE